MSITPSEYAQTSHENYLSKYAHEGVQVVMLGMNPDPWGMAQTGVPFGEVAAARDWLKVGAEVGKPKVEHPKRPVQGFDCPRSEVSGRRLWGWAMERFKTPEAFFERFFVLNYCPLSFMEESGRNRIPEKLPADERAPLFKACDKALSATIDALKPEWVLGVGGFAEKRARTVLDGRGLKFGKILHPSPASPPPTADGPRRRKSNWLHWAFSRCLVLPCRQPTRDIVPLMSFGFSCPSAWPSRPVPSKIPSKRRKPAESQKWSDKRLYRYPLSNLRTLEPRLNPYLSRVMSLR